ncbi:MAG TPA: enoyl-CoA hydratase-related protein [Alphaproteobacteria bacterium]|nr:enoyl-CoA hydratase-related protein [Alphaproteobacteria bacterium]
MSETDAVLLTVEGPVATIALNRPKALNALNVELAEALLAVTRKVAADPAVRVVVLTGTGDNFMAGGDIRMFAGLLEKAPQERVAVFSEMVRKINPIVEAFRAMDKPIVASVRGAVAGFGLSLVMATDLAIAADNAFFTLAYRHIGLTPDGGASYFLPRTVPMKVAMELALLGDRFDAEAARGHGIVNRVVPLDQLDAATGKLCRMLAAGPADVMARTKRLLLAAVETPLSRHLEAEADSFGTCAGQPDFAEGVRAFLEKRPAKFA